MNSIQWLSHSAAETFDLGRRLATVLESNDVIGLTGELGAGKTTLVQGICSGLGYAGYATSPTFTLMHLYPTSPKIYHVDCFRIQNQDQFESAGFSDLIAAQQGIILVEWANIIENYFKDWSIEIAISFVLNEDNQRLINLTFTSEERNSYFASVCASLTKRGTS